MPVLQDDNYLKMLRPMVSHAHWNQRDLAGAPRIDLGKTNYGLQDLVAKGRIKIRSLRCRRDKLAQVYLLVPLGIAEKSNVKARLLKHKLAAYARLQGDLELLTGEPE